MYFHTGSYSLRAIKVSRACGSTGRPTMPVVVLVVAKRCSGAARCRARGRGAEAPKEMARRAAMDGHKSCGRRAAARQASIVSCARRRAKLRLAVRRCCARGGATASLAVCKAALLGWT